MKAISKIHIVLALIVLAVFIWSAIHPKDRLDWFAESIPAVVICIVLVATYWRFQLTTLSYTIIAMLSVVMFIGGHYTYEEMPLFNWLKDEFHLKRNHYDRLGHFLKGFGVIIIQEVLFRLTTLRTGAWLASISASMLMAIAALYEIVEWLSTYISKKGEAENDFLGMQGDKWDAQWDMTCALIGTLVALVLLTKWHNTMLKPFRRTYPK